MRRAAVVAIAGALAGCSAPQHATVAPVPVAKPAAPATTAGPAIAWTDVTGETYVAFVEQLADDPAWALARELLRDGNLTCTRQRNDCGYLGIDDAADDETVADPCLRRAVLRRLISRPGPLPDDVLAGLTNLTADRDLIAVAGMDRSDETLIALEAAVERAGGDRMFLGSVAPELAADAVSHQHVAAAVEAVDGRRDPDVLLAVVADPTFAADVRVDAMFVIAMWATEPDASAGSKAAGAKLATLASGLVNDADCSIAAKAAEMRATLANDASYVPRRPHTRDRATMLRALCVALHYQGGDGELVLDTYVPAAGLEEVYPDGRPGKKKHKPKHYVLPRNNGTYGSYDLRNFLEEYLGLALDQAAGRPCTGDTCNEPTVELGFVRDAGELVLGRVTIRRNLAGEQRRAEAAEALAQMGDECDEGD